MMRIQVRQFDPTEIDSFPTRLDTFGIDATSLIDFGTISKVKESESKLIGLLIRIWSMDDEQGIQDLKFYLINNLALKDSEIRYFLSNQIEKEINWDEMTKIAETASEAEIIPARNESNQIIGLTQTSKFIYLKIRVGEKENFGKIGGENIDIFKFACQYHEIGTGLLKIKTIPGKIQIKPNSQDLFLHHLPNLYDKSETSNVYKFLSIFSEEKDTIMNQGFQIQLEHWVDSAHYVID